jgi:hypothetical protein
MDEVDCSACGRDECYDQFCGCEKELTLENALEESYWAGYYTGKAETYLPAVYSKKDVQWWGKMIAWSERDEVE